jgi:hypothetical protein
MNYYEALAQAAKPVEVEEHETSYFSKPEGSLDPSLFQGMRLRSFVREAILTLLINHLELGYNEPSEWATAYLAGSGVSYQWSSNRLPKDLDCLVSINYIQFRQSNQEYKGWSDQEVADEINQGFRNELLPRTKDFLNNYELTFYVNVNSSIEQLNPYSAYSVTQDSWVIPPSFQDVVSNPEWDKITQSDVTLAKTIVGRYTTALDKIQAAANSAMRVNAEYELATAVLQGAALFEDLHSSRSQAFKPGGSGYSDFTNYRWQSGKRSGVISAMKALHDVSKEAEGRFSTETYGMELPDTSTLIRRSIIK